MIHTLEADSIILEFGAKRVLQDVYLKIETGRVTGLLGRNGTGKSCLMNIIYGSLVPNNKSVRIDGKAIFKGYAHSENIRYLPQFGFVPKHLTIKRIFKDFNLDFSRFANLFPEFEKYYTVSLNKLSGGEQRMVEIYSIISSETKFCLLDEPFSHIMPKHVETLKTIINEEKHKKGILMTDHLYRDIIDVCDSIYVLLNGKTYLTKSIQDIETLGYAQFKD